MGIVWAHYPCFLYSFCIQEMNIPLLGGQLPMTGRLWRRRFLDFTYSQRAFCCHIDLRAVCDFTFTVLVRVRGPVRVSTMLWVRDDSRSDSVFHSLAPWRLSKLYPERDTHSFPRDWVKPGDWKSMEGKDTHLDFEILRVRASGVPKWHSTHLHLVLSIHSNSEK